MVQGVNGQATIGRDAVAMVRAGLAGDDEALALLVLGTDLDDAPAVIGSLVQLVGLALGAPAGSPPEAFVRAALRFLDDAERRAGDGGGES